MSLLFLLAFLVLGGVLAILVLPGLWEHVAGTREMDAQEAMDLALDGLGGYDEPERPSRLADLRRMAPDARPVPVTELAESEQSGLGAFLERLASARKTDDPSAWPDPGAAAATLAEARETRYRAELDAEGGAQLARGGRAAAPWCELALQMLVRAHSQGAADTDVLTELGYLALARGRQRGHSHADVAARAALQLANRALELQPGNRSAALLGAAAQVALGRLSPARQQLVLLLGQGEMDGPYRRVRSRWLYAENDEHGAVEALLDHLDEMDEGAAMVERLRLAPWLSARGRWNEAEAAYATVVAWRPDVGAAWLGVARCAEARAAWSDVHEAAKHAIENGAGKRARELMRVAVVELARQSD